jgi:hypothetical protein
MNPRTLLLLTPYLDQGRHNIKELAEKSGLGKLVVHDLLLYAAANGIGRFDGNIANFGWRDKISCALLAVQLGCSVDEASSQIGWRDFEDLVGELLVAEGYTVKMNVRLKKPPAQIDIFAYCGNTGLAIDCKHWKRTMGAASMRLVVARQRLRAERLVGEGSKDPPLLQRFYPVIATLYEEDVHLIDGVPIVPIVKLANFLRGFEGYTENLRDVCCTEEVRRR